MTTLTLNRRSLLAAGIGVAALRALPVFAADEPFFKRHNLTLGLQIYALGNNVLDDLDDTFAKVRAAGYRAVEMPFEFANLDAVKLKSRLDHWGLVCPSAQSVLGPDIDLSKLADGLHTVGADTVVNQTVESYIVGEPWTNSSDRTRLLHTTPDGWRRAAHFLNEKGAALKQRGIKLCYHNHNFEFAPVAGDTGENLLIKYTEPGAVYFQLDIGWCATAGKDPVVLFSENKGRFWSAHLKDIKASTRVNYLLHQGTAPGHKDPQMDNAILGQGKLNWPKILPAAYAAGVRRYFVEHEDPNRSVAAIRASREYLMGVIA